MKLIGKIAAFRRRRGRLLVGMVIPAALMAGASGQGMAHGIKETGNHYEGATKPEPMIDILNLLFSTAEAEARMRIDEAGGYRYIEADGLPDHDTGSFPNRSNPNRITAQEYKFRMTLRPEQSGRVEWIGHMPFGIAINGVVFDPLTAEYWNRDRRSGWNIDALSGVMLGLDQNNAHVQPDGSYHYHAVPTGLINQFDRSRPVLLGYAADGFPIYGPEGYASGKIGPVHELKSSWRLKDGNRPGGSEGPGGRYDGTYTRDFEYVAGLGDLDECNGRFAPTPEHPDGIYHYVLTNSYPYIPRCFSGTPDSSFRRKPGGGGQGGIANMPGEKVRGVRDRQGGPRMGGMPQGGGGRPDLNAAAQRLGISMNELRAALGPPPPNFEQAARTLGIPVEDLMRALHPDRY
ncbi:YHYH protein [Aestuariispira insulae]|uniref:YHYH protein n=1 Tax=Aestuariispira insulae TaxID=1461337 RepID=A0A3D9HTB9_9PROT|nr:YHYH protein [Aestuariispira insulae]RED52126.1 YHYH protein [Aestuariispira insulae]